MKLLEISEWAALHGVLPGTARKWARKGKLRGARKFGQSWAIPDTTKPAAGRPGNPGIKQLRRQTLARQTDVAAVNPQDVPQDVLGDVPNESAESPT